MIFSLAYYVLFPDQPTEFVGLHTRLDTLYFSMATVTTVGYGDVSAHGQVARALVTCQLAFNLVFVGALVGLFQSRFQDLPCRTKRPAEEGNRGSRSGAGPEQAKPTKASRALHFRTRTAMPSPGC